MYIKRVLPVNAFFALLSLYLIIITNASAVQTHVLMDVSHADFAKGEMSGMALQGHGSLEPAPALELITELAEPVIWSIVGDADGNYFVGTGNSGKVVKVTADGESETLFQPDAIISRALALDDEGRLYVGTSPHGAIYRIPAGGGLPEIFHDPENMYIWDLAISDGWLWFAAGMPAEFWRISLSDPKAKAEKWFSARETHFTSLAKGHDGEWILGGSPRGILYSVTGADEGRSLFQAAEDEIRRIQVADDGRIVFLAYTGARERSSPRSPGGTESSGDLSLQSPTVPGKGVLYVRYPNGYVLPWWQNTQEGISSLIPFGGQYWLLGMGQGGGLTVVEDRDRWAQIQKIDKGGEVVALLADPVKANSIIVATSQPAALYRLGGGADSDAVYTSAVKDGTQIVGWGHLEISGTGLDDIVVETRSGNTPDADALWSGWRALDAAEKLPVWRGPIQSEPARYLQYRITFEVGLQSQVQQVRAFIRLPNQGPIIADLRTMSVGVELMEAPTGSRNTDIDNIFKTNPPDKVFDAPPARQQFSRMPDPGLRSFFWRVIDPNGDRLQASVFLRPEGERDWTLLEAERVQPFYVLNTQGWPEGLYRLKIVVSDAPDNTDMPLSAERISTPFLVDHQPPVIKVLSQKRDGLRWTLEWRVADEMSVIRAVEIRVEGGEPISVLPVDGFTDSREETFHWSGEAKSRGAITVLIEAVDESGRRVSKAVKVSE